jgi:hypothetical protein
MLSLLANRTRFETYYKQTDLNSLLNFLDLTTRARISQPGITTGEARFAEGENVCRELYFGHSANLLFAECRSRQKKNTRHKIFCREPNTRQTNTLGKQIP